MSNKVCQEAPFFVFVLSLAIIFFLFFRKFSPFGLIWIKNAGYANKDAKVHLRSSHRVKAFQLSRTSECRKGGSPVLSKPMFEDRETLAWLKKDVRQNLALFPCMQASTSPFLMRGAILRVESFLTCTSAIT